MPACLPIPRTAAYSACPPAAVSRIVAYISLHRQLRRRASNPASHSIRTFIYIFVHTYIYTYLYPTSILSSPFPFLPVQYISNGRRLLYPQTYSQGDRRWRPSSLSFPRILFFFFLLNTNYIYVYPLVLLFLVRYFSLFSCNNFKKVTFPRITDS